MKSKIYPETLEFWFTKTGKKPADLARHIDITKGAITQWLKGARPIPENHLSKIAEFFGCTVRDIYISDEDAQIRSLIRERIARQEGDDLVQTLKYLRNLEKREHHIEEENQQRLKNQPPLKKVANGD